MTIQEIRDLFLKYFSRVQIGGGEIQILQDIIKTYEHSAISEAFQAAGAGNAGNLHYVLKVLKRIREEPADETAAMLERLNAGVA